MIVWPRRRRHDTLYRISMSSRTAIVACLFAVLISNAATVVRADISIVLQGEGDDGRRHDRDREHERDRYRPYHRDERRGYYAPGDREPPYVQQPLPDNSPRDLTTVSQRLYDVKQLLDRKGKERAITADQYQSEANYLAEIDKDAHANAFNQGGHLTADQETYFLQQLQQTQLAIDQNLIVH